MIGLQIGICFFLGAGILKILFVLFYLFFVGVLNDFKVTILGAKVNLVVSELFLSHCFFLMEVSLRVCHSMFFW